MTRGPSHKQQPGARIHRLSQGPLLQQLNTYCKSVDKSDVTKSWLSMWCIVIEPNVVHVASNVSRDHELAILRGVPIFFAVWSPRESILEYGRVGRVNGNLGDSIIAPGTGANWSPSWC